jgi:hypothetical protein
MTTNPGNTDPHSDPVAASAATVPSLPPLRLSWHIASHRVLVPDLDDVAVAHGVQRSLGAVVVPAGRAADNLGPAARVARIAGCHLLILCSGKADPWTASQVAGRALPTDSFTVVELPPGWSIPRLELRADRLPGVVGRRVDTSAKRNVGLLVARQLGWENILFLDDDVRGFSPRHVLQVRRGLAEGHESSEAVGWAFDQYPDNSMVCHAYRRAGGVQDTFIGGGALAVKVSPWTPHFPDVYNEDWLFMLRLMLRRRSALALAGTLRQVSYDPFAVPLDAAKQEFGDVLGEGLFRLLHSGRSISAATSAKYWIGMLRLRLRMVEKIKEVLLTRGDPGDARACAALDSAFASSKSLSEWPLQLAEWVFAWSGDCLSWSRRMASLPQGLGMDHALRNLDLVSFDAGHGPSRTSGRAVHGPRMLRSVVPSDIDKEPPLAAASRYLRRRASRTDHQVRRDADA